MTEKTAVDGLVEALEQIGVRGEFCEPLMSAGKMQTTAIRALAAYRSSRQEPQCQHGNWIDCAQCDSPTSQADELLRDARPWLNKCFVSNDYEEQQRFVAFLSRIQAYFDGRKW